MNNGKILVVEDDLVGMRLLKPKLRAGGSVVIGAADDTAALLVWQR